MNISRSDRNFRLIMITGIPLFGIFALIFILSAQPGSASDTTSGTVVNILPEFISEYFEQHFGLEELQAFMLIDSIIRTGAHFGEYAFLAVFCLLHFNQIFYKYNFIFSFLISLIYSISDEVHQIFVDGRTFQIQDIGTDTAGIVFGLIFCFLFNFIIRKFSTSEKN